MGKKSRMMLTTFLSHGLALGQVQRFSYQNPLVGPVNEGSIVIQLEAAKDPSFTT